jgi:transposase
MTVNDLVEADHPVRKVWRFAEGLDLSALYDRIRARGPRPGRSPADPRLLVALWLYAIYDGVVSARELADLCTSHNAYRWLCGGVSVNHHTLSDFLVDHGQMLETLLTHSVEVLRQQGLVPLKRVAQDGLRVRASAGAASFHRQQTLQKQLQEAQSLVRRLQDELKGQQGQAGGNDRQPSPEVISGEEEVASGAEAEGVAEPSEGEAELSREQAARLRAALGRLQRAEQALDRLPEMGAKKKKEDKEKARTSTTDAQATVMKMPDGGFRPAYNIQFCTDCDNQVVVGVEVVQTGSDQGQLRPMLAQVQERFDKRPEEALADGGFVKLEEIEEIQKGEGGKEGTKVYAPVPQPKAEKRDRYAPLPDDAEQVAQWRVRMGTDEAKEIYKQRAQTAECVNAQARNRGLVRLLVRGVQKVKAVALWFASVHNMARSFTLLPQRYAEPAIAT